LTRLLFAALALALGAIVELALPGQPVYHAGWYNVLLSALVVVTIAAARKRFRAAAAPRTRFAILAIVFGAATAGVAAVANGLLAPDNQTFVGAPGERIRVEGLGVLVFPIVADAERTPSVSLQRALHAPIEIGARARDAGGFVLRASQRDVVYVEARDVLGNRLTVTQPRGASFLSPVLMMRHRQNIAGLDLPYDSFNVPAARRVVKAVLFTPAQAAMLLRRTETNGQGAVLFAVDDERDRPLPHAIALSAGGRAVRVGGLWLRATVAGYPAVEVVATPNVAAVAIGTLLVLGGTIALFT
jgi:hypothetical protein